jgi:hypothetical protein
MDAEEEDIEESEVGRKLPNYDNLSDEERLKASERRYRLQLKEKYGYREGETPYELKRKRGEVGGF